MYVAVTAYVWMNQLRMSVRVVDPTLDGVETVLERSSWLRIEGRDPREALDLVAMMGEELLNIAYERDLAL